MNAKKIFRWLSIFAAVLIALVVLNSWLFVDGKELAQYLRDTNITKIELAKIYETSEVSEKLLGVTLNAAQFDELTVGVEETLFYRYGVQPYGIVQNERYILTAYDIQGKTILQITLYDGKFMILDCLTRDGQSIHTRLMAVNSKLYDLFDTVVQNGENNIVNKVNAMITGG